MIYLIVLLGAMAVGFWPDAIYPSRADYEIVTLRPLQTLAVGQVAFVLLIYPLVLYGRRQKGLMRRYVGEAALESIGLLAVAVPFYAVAGYVANAVVWDVIRTAACVACLFPLAWVAGAWMVRSSFARPWVMIDGFIIVIGLPAAWYIAREFFTTDPLDWLWWLAPATFAWETAASRMGCYLPQPLWALLVWPAVACVSALCLLVWKPSAQKKG